VIGDNNIKPSHALILTHFNISVVGRKGRFYTKERTVKEQDLENAMSLAELQSSHLSNCDASFSSNQSNLLSHQGLLMVQSIDTKSLFKHQNSIIERLSANNKHKRLIEYIMSTTTPRWAKIQKVSQLIA
jgi:hypothetical protein